MNLEVLDKNGNNSGEVEVSDFVFGTEWNPDLVHEVYVSERSNRRQPTSSTKDRSEVSGGGRKPWPQKGTGRARHGSIRSPIWTGGGVTFGPRDREKDFSKKINKKVKTKALFSLLSKKREEGEFRVVDSLNLEADKTKEARKMLEDLFGGEYGSVLFVPADENKDLRKLISNIENVSAMSPRNLNVLDILQYEFLVFEEESIKVVENHFSIEKESVNKPVNV